MINWTKTPGHQDLELGRLRTYFLNLVVFSFAAVPRSISRIVGGKDTDISVYPFMSNMQFLEGGLWWRMNCGGSLLTRTSVLSAAHCF